MFRQKNNLKTLSKKRLVLGVECMEAFLGIGRIAPREIYMKSKLMGAFCNRGENLLKTTTVFNRKIINLKKSLRIRDMLADKQKISYIRTR